MTGIFLPAIFLFSGWGERGVEENVKPRELTDTDRKDEEYGVIHNGAAFETEMMQKI
ncbi:MAG: hypothetical protein GF417_13320 [Candidatus Latescibacteria bacterium]|nr:hypothetical protein [bacterium]MBD3425408.1 hypothetical protein [Candidatus Latescibacterota bacterium]